MMATEGWPKGTGRGEAGEEKDNMKAGKMIEARDKEEEIRRGSKARRIK